MAFAERRCTVRPKDSRAVATPASPQRGALGSFPPTIPIFAPLPLDRDTRRIADLDPCRARPRSIGTIDPLRDDALGAQLACMLEYGRTIPGNMFVEKDVGLDAAQQARQGGLTVEERKVTQV